MKTYVIGDVHGRLWLLKRLLSEIPIDCKSDKIIFLGDLIDRGENAPGVVEEVIRLRKGNPQVICIRGNHEQMLLNFIKEGDLVWLLPANGGMKTLSQYGCRIEETGGFSNLRIPSKHIDFFNSLPLYHEDDLGLYVHAGVTPGLHPADEDAEFLLWSRSADFYENYNGKRCFFGHTPAMYLPNAHTRNRSDIYICNRAIGIDTGFGDEDPLSCLELETGTLHQAFPDRPVESKQVVLPEIS